MAVTMLLIQHPKTWSLKSGQRSVASLVQVASCFGVLAYQKFQITNIKQITMAKFEIPKLFFVLVIEYWNLRFVCNLVLGVWDFIE